MRDKLARLISHPWTLAILGLLAFAIIIWFGASYIKFGEENTTISPLIRIVIISIVCSIWFLWQLINILITRKNERALNEQITKSADNSESNRSNEELQAINQRFREAINTLKNNNIKGRKRSIYQLPWYLLIGPPGAGKTTALINSGLDFPLSKDKQAQPLEGIGGTRQCDWWFSNHAVLIDTAGRYTTQDSHRVVDNSAWHGFLLMLRKYRKRRPINGVIVSISIQDVMVQTTDQRLQSARTIRTRLDELREQLGIEFPVYLSFTKCDLIAGFTEYFQHLTSSEREQVLGVTFTEGNEGSLTAQFSSEYTTILQRLNARLLSKINLERDMTKRGTLQNFPARMESLQSLLEEYIATLLSSSSYTETPKLRGVYFTSATQEGNPVDRMMAAVSANFGLSRDNSKQLVASGKSYFLKRLLLDVIFHESELVGSNQSVERKINTARYLGFIALAVLTIGSLLVWSGAITQNKLLNSTIDEKLTAYVKARPSAKEQNPLLTLSSLEQLKTAAELSSSEQNPWLTNLGLHDRQVSKQLNSLYNEQLKLLLLPRIGHSMEQMLSAQNTNDANLLATLKAYLSLTQQHTDSAHVIKEWVNQDWQQHYSGKGSEIDALENHLTTLLAQPNLILSSNQEAIDIARAKLRRTPPVNRLYASLKNNQRQGNVDLRDVISSDNLTQAFNIGPNSPLLRPPYLYTKAGYDELDFSKDSPLLSQMSKDRWIYGDNSVDDFTEKDKEKLTRELKRLYLNDYNNQWLKLVSDLKLRPFSNLSDASKQLSILADPAYSPLYGIIEAISENTQITPIIDKELIPKNKAAQLAANIVASKQAPPTIVDKQFNKLHQLTKGKRNQPARINHYIELIASTQQYIDEINTSPDSKLASFEAAKARFSGKANILNKLRIEAKRAPTPLNYWLVSIADNSWKAILGNAKAHLDTQWRQQVFNDYQNYITGRYPISNSNSDIPIIDFNNFFSPSGSEKQFINTYLAPFVDTRKWRNKSIDGYSIGVSASSLQQFKRSQAIRSALYKGDDQVAFDFRLQPAKLDSSVRNFELSIGSKSLDYSHGPRVTKKFKWLGGVDTIAEISFEDLNSTNHNKRYEGDWALFRMLDDASIEVNKNKSSYLVLFKKDGRKAQLRLTANSANNPFRENLFNRYRCPKVL